LLVRLRKKNVLGENRRENGAVLGEIASRCGKKKPGAVASGGRARKKEVQRRGKRGLSRAIHYYDEGSASAGSKGHHWRTPGKTFAFRKMCN